MTNYEFGDVVLVSFPFTDHTGLKKRPAVIVSSSEYLERQPDVIVLAVTSQAQAQTHFGVITITHWKEAGLLKPSVIKPIVFTVDKRLILRKIGELQKDDRSKMNQGLERIMGG